MKLRSLLTLGAALFAGIGGGAIVGAQAGSFTGPIGLQLYSLREQFQRDVPGSLDRVKSWGIHEVELAGTYHLPAPEFLGMLKDRGLTPISSHVSWEDITQKTPEMVDFARKLGLKYLGVAWIPHKGVLDQAQAEEIAAEMNRVGEQFHKAGIRFFDHCHGYEFDPKGASPAGLKAMDVLIQKTRPEWVTFEMDVFWVKFPGEDPAAWLAKYPGRWQLMHVKDMRRGLETGKHNGGTDVSNDVAAGTGQMDWPAILKTARRSGVKHYFIEDESSVSETQIPQTIQYLRTVRY